MTPADSTEYRRYPFWGYEDLMLFIGAVLPCVALASLVAIGIRRLGPPWTAGSAADVLIAQFLGYGLWFLVLYWILRVRHGQPFWRALAWKASATDMAACFAAGPPLALIVAMLSTLLGTPDVDMPIKALLTSRWNILLVGAFAVSLGPLCEELAFRGFLMPLVSKSFGPAAGIIIAAAPFALLHGPQYGWSWRHIALVGMAGVAFGWARYKTGSTGAATAIHATYNLTFFAGYLLQQGDHFATW